MMSWDQLVQPVAGFVLWALNSLVHWLPAPWQGRSAWLLKTFIQPALNFLLGYGAIFLLWKYFPRSWWAKIPERWQATIRFPLFLYLGCVGVLLFLVALPMTIFALFGLNWWQTPLASIGVLVFWAFWAWVNGKDEPFKWNHTSHGSAAWGKVDEARNLGRMAPKGMIQTALALGHIRGIDPQTEDSRLWYGGHVLTCAPTGSGKGIGAVIPNLLQYPGSALVVDIKGENFAVTQRKRKALGQAVYCVDPFQVTGSEGHAFNWLAALDPDDPNVVSDSAMLAEMLVIPDKHGDSYWDDAAKELIRGLLIHVAGFAEEHRHMGEVRRLLTLPEEAFRLVLREMAENSSGFGIVARTANTFLGKADKERSGVLSSAIRHTAFLDDPRIVRALARSDFDLRAIKREKMSVYIAMPPAKLGAYSRFLRCFVGLALAAVTNDAQKPQYPVVFFLDEFGQLGRMTAVEDAISLVRGYGASLWIFVQDLSQLKGVYPRWQTFLANTAKQFFGTADLETARYISQALGNYTESYSSENRGGQYNTRSEHFMSRALLSPDEVMRLGAHRPIVLIAGERPYLLARLNYLHDPVYAGMADDNPFHAPPARKSDPA